MLTAPLRNAIRRHARDSYPNECCGLLVTDNTTGITNYMPAPNAAVRSTNHFVLPASLWAHAEDSGVIVGVVHSHPDWTAKPTQADMVQCEMSQLPWYIQEIRADGQFGELHVHRPSGYRAPLVGRDFFHSVLDCYTIVKDFYERQRGIILPDFEREDGWWNTEQEVYLDNFAKADFVDIGLEAQLKPGDVILMQYQARRVNHAAVFLDTEILHEAPDLFPVPNAILHHLYGQISKRDVFGGLWYQCRRVYLRHRKFLEV